MNAFSILVVFLALWPIIPAQPPKAPNQPLCGWPHLQCAPPDEPPPPQNFFCDWTHIDGYKDDIQKCTPLIDCGKEVYWDTERARCGQVG